VAAPPLLRIYLNDHLAGATAGLAVARRCQGRNSSGPLGAFLADLTQQISEDRQSLEEVMRRLDAPANPAKIALARLLERAGLLKLNGSLTRYTDLSRLLELEALVAGVKAKHSMWRALRLTVASDPRLASVDFDRLVERAETQLAALEEHHAEAAALAFGGSRQQGSPGVLAGPGSATERQG
jgi:hypothetical protein